MKKSKYTGLGVAMVTPFDKNKEVDTKSLENLTKHLLHNDTDFLVVQGTTGETPVLNEEEKKKVLDTVVEVNNGEKPILLGFGGNNTNLMLEQLEKLDTERIEGLLIASPYYNKPTQKGLVSHYGSIADNTDLDIMLYNVPGRTGNNILPGTVHELANKHKNIIGIKEASGDMEQVMDVIAHQREGFVTLSGEDPLTLPMIACGAEGVISVTGNAFPKKYGEMVHAAMKSDMQTAREAHYQLLETFDLLFKEGNPGGIKELLSHMGICENTLRLPLEKVSKELSGKIAKL